MRSNLWSLKIGKFVPHPSPPYPSPPLPPPSTPQHNPLKSLFPLDLRLWKDYVHMIFRKMKMTVSLGKQLDELMGLWKKTGEDNYGIWQLHTVNCINLLWEQNRNWDLLPHFHIYHSNQLVCTCITCMNLNFWTVPKIGKLSLAKIRENAQKFGDS